MTYRELLDPTIKRFEVAAAIQGSAKWNATGSKALAQLLKEVSGQFDDYVEAQGEKGKFGQLNAIQLLQMAREFEFKKGIKVVFRGNDLWAISNQTEVYNRLQEWEYEPNPSSQDKEFFDRCRYTLEEAIEIAIRL